MISPAPNQNLVKYLIILWPKMYQFCLNWLSSMIYQIPGRCLVDQFQFKFGQTPCFTVYLSYQKIILKTSKKKKKWALAYFKQKEVCLQFYPKWFNLALQWVFTKRVPWFNRICCSITIGLCKPMLILITRPDKFDGSPVLHRDN